MSVETPSISVGPVGSSVGTSLGRGVESGFSGGSFGSISMRNIMSMPQHTVGSFVNEGPGPIAKMAFDTRLTTELVRVDSAKQASIVDTRIPDLTVKPMEVFPSQAFTLEPKYISPATRGLVFKPPVVQKTVPEIAKSNPNESSNLNAVQEIGEPLQEEGKPPTQEIQANIKLAQEAIQGIKEDSNLSEEQKFEMTQKLQSALEIVNQAENSVEPQSLILEEEASQQIQIDRQRQEGIAIKPLMVNIYDVNTEVKVDDEDEVVDTKTESQYRETVPIQKLPRKAAEILASGADTIILENRQWRPGSKSEVLTPPMQELDQIAL